MHAVTTLVCCFGSVDWSGDICGPMSVLGGRSLSTVLQAAPVTLRRLHAQASAARTATLIRAQTLQIGGAFEHTDASLADTHGRAGARFLLQSQRCRVLLLFSSGVKQSLTSAHRCKETQKTITKTELPNIPLPKNSHPLHQQAVTDWHPFAKNAVKILKISTK